ncbi:hypothetical protein [Candidatus Protochlamydia phocaeensis]|uniref:hypothetical protein n=1 Tax=Candidatus Protochlamydia phocaeensis TaxID=1414722 RepID=UPI000838AD99|nr:hypothetical protein [Candidatus Protochlamydia phocaeensis]
MPKATSSLVSLPAYTQALIFKPEKHIKKKKISLRSSKVSHTSLQAIKNLHHCLKHMVHVRYDLKSRIQQEEGTYRQVVSMQKTLKKNVSYTLSLISKLHLIMEGCRNEALFKSSFFITEKMKATIIRLHYALKTHLSELNRSLQDLEDISFSLEDLDWELQQEEQTLLFHHKGQARPLSIPELIAAVRKLRRQYLN